jgi:hypothetical protein
MFPHWTVQMSDRKVGASQSLGALYGLDRTKHEGDVYQQLNVQINHNEGGKNSVDRIGEIFGGLNSSIGRALSPVLFRGGFSISWRWALFIAAFLIPNIDVAAPIFVLWFLSLFIPFH